MSDRSNSDKLNWYEAPRAALEEAASEEFDRAVRLRAGFVTEERNIRSVAWLNLVLAMLTGLSTAEVAAESIPQSSMTSRMLAVGAVILGSLVVWLNIWIWYALRRFSPLARLLAMIEACIGIALGIIVAGYFIWDGGALFAAFLVLLVIAFAPSVFVYLLISARVRTLFQPSYQEALNVTRRRRFDPKWVAHL